MAESAKGAVERATGKASVAALTAGCKASEAAREAKTVLGVTEDPEDCQATLTCSELARWLTVKPGKGRLEIKEAWFGHPHDPARRRDVTAEAQSRVGSENGLELTASRELWGNPCPHGLGILSVTYRRHPVAGEPTPGEQLRLRVAREALGGLLERASYEALKQAAGSPAVGTWICATPVLMGMPMPGSSVHAVYVSSAEIVYWAAERGVVSTSYAAFLREVGNAKVEVVQRPQSVSHAEEVARCARSFLRDGSAEVSEKVESSEAFAAHCHGSQAGISALEAAKAASTMGMAVLVAAHVDEAAAAVALPLLGVAPAAAVGIIGAVVVSPLLLAGLWHMRRRNDARMGFSVMNLTRARISASTFELDDRTRIAWGPLRTSCMGLGGCMSLDLEPNQLLELNPPSSSEDFQLHCLPAPVQEKVPDAPGPYRIVNDVGAIVKCGVDFQSEQVATLSKGSHVNVLEVVPLDAERRLRARIEEPAGWISLLNTKDGHRLAVRSDQDEVNAKVACAQVVMRGRVYWVLENEGTLFIREVPRCLVPAYAPTASCTSAPA